MAKKAAAVGAMAAGLTLAMATARAADPVPQAVPFDLSEVRLLDGPFKHAQELDHAYLLSLDPDRLLHTFRLNAGLPSTATPYGGWEDPKCELRGHSMGHYLSACSLMYRSTGDPKLKERSDYLVAELAKCQAALAETGEKHPGYLSAFPETLFDRVDRQEKVWAPWYTMHKIMAGLLEVYQQTGNQQALNVLTRLADWVKFRVDRLTPEQMQRSLNTEHGGMNEVLANLYGVTHNPEYLRISEAFNHHAVLDPLARGEDKLDGLHANTQIPKVIGAARQYELTGDREYRNVAEFFWNDVALQRSYAFGGHSDSEHFFPVRDFPKHLDWCTAETCNTYNMLKLTRHLFAWDPSAQEMDIYERALYNHILASQDEHGMMIYFLSSQSGHFKTYMTPDQSFWCCTGTGMENHAKYGDTIYFHSPSDDALYVNLFVASELNWKKKGLEIRQETRFPEEDTTRLTFHCAQPVELALKVRYPSWETAGMVMDVNGSKVDVDGKRGSYVTVSRAWHDGDQLAIRLPMSLHVEPLPHGLKDVAIMYGPIVLAGEMGKEGMATDHAKNQGAFRKVPDPVAPAVVTAQPTDLLSHVHPIDGRPLAFKTEGLLSPGDLTLVPLYQVRHERYAIYFPIYTPAEWTTRQERATTQQGR